VLERGLRELAHGKAPPGGEDEVVRFVLRVPGAIGYVSAGTALNGAKVLNIK